MQQRLQKLESMSHGDREQLEKTDSELEISQGASEDITAKIMKRRLGRRSSLLNVKNEHAKLSLLSPDVLRNEGFTTFLEERDLISINGGLFANASIVTKSTTPTISAESEAAMGLRETSGALDEKLPGLTMKH
jgi:hypothetical protein